MVQLFFHSPHLWKKIQFNVSFLISISLWKAYWPSLRFILPGRLQIVCFILQFPPCLPLNSTCNQKTMLFIHIKHLQVLQYDLTILMDVEYIILILLFVPYILHIVLLTVIYQALEYVSLLCMYKKQQPNYLRLFFRLEHFTVLFRNMYLGFSF